MSRFDEDAANGIALRTVRVRTGKRLRDSEPRPPLLGYETLLLAALRDAEQAHDAVAQRMAVESSAIATDKQELAAARKHHREFLKHIKAALEEWHAMGPDARRWLVWPAHVAGSPVGEWNGSSDYLDPTVSRYEAILNDLQRVAAEVSEVEFPRGRKPGVSQSSPQPIRLEPLRAFVAVLKVFFEKVTGEPFGQEFERPVDNGPHKVPISAAARLVWEATQYLDEDYTTANIETVLRDLQGTSAK